MAGGIRFAVLAGSLLLAGCGSPDKSGQSRTDQLPSDLANAVRPDPSRFPSSRGKSLSDLVDRYGMDRYKLVPATSITVTGENRFAFAVVDESNELVYGDTALYVSDGPLKEDARGPYLSPADLIFDRPSVASKDASPPAIYRAMLTFPRIGRATIYALTRTDDGLVGSAVAYAIRNKRSDKVLNVGDVAPVVDTGNPSPNNIDEECTRVPPDSMHTSSLAANLGKRPVALIFSTPSFCESRVCGPVLDVAERSKDAYGDRVEFIHEEVFNGNDPALGYRASLSSFGLTTEPWLFTIDKRGRIAARLEGAFGEEDFESAVRAAL